MWSRISLRMKITILTTFTLALVVACITFLSVRNSNQLFVERAVVGMGAFFTEANLIDISELDLEIIETSSDWRVFDTEINKRQDWVIRDGDEALIAERFAERLVGLHLAEYQSNFQVYSIVVAVIFILVGAIGAYTISGQALKPVKSLAGKMENIDVNNLTAQIAPPQTNDEISRLTHTFNNMLDKINRSFETQKHFAQNAAHELKTPLAFVKASIDVLHLDDEPTNEEYKDVIGIVKNSTERLIELVDGLLSINNSTDEMQWHTFSARNVFDTIINELKNDITHKGLDSAITGDCHITGDNTLLERAFFNLVHNAVRYNVESGSVKITLSDNGVIIEDSGIGISDEHLTHIFEPFYCADKSRSKKLGGHGLGMTIAKNIFDRHGMKICIFSEVGQGTKITLTGTNIFCK